MLNKIYVKIKEFLKNNYLFIIGLIIGVFLATYELPYYISAPGGVIDISSKIKVENANKVEGSFNMAYVTEYKATIPMFLIAQINSDWDLDKKSDILSSIETDNDVNIRNHILLKEANQSAVIYAYKKAGKTVKSSNTKVYATYIYEEAKTNLKVGDIILSVNDIKIDNKYTLLEVIQNSKVGDTLNIKVINNDTEYTRTAEIIEIDGLKIIGIMISQISDYEVEPNIEIKFKESESGPSGGLMMSLAIYNYLTPIDITKGKKIAGTGTIDLEGNVGSIGGVEYKIKGAVKDKVKYFLIPSGDNYEEAMTLKKEKNYDIEIIPISTFDEALECLNKLQ